MPENHPAMLAYRRRAAVHSAALRARRDRAMTTLAVGESAWSKARYHDYERGALLQCAERETRALLHLAKVAYASGAKKHVRSGRRGAVSRRPINRARARGGRSGGPAKPFRMGGTGRGRRISARVGPATARGARFFRPRN